MGTDPQEDGETTFALLKLLSEPKMQWYFNFRFILFWTKYFLDLVKFWSPSFLTFFFLLRARLGSRHAAWAGLERITWGLEVAWAPRPGLRAELNILQKIQKKWEKVLGKFGSLNVNLDQQWMIANVLTAASGCRELIQVKCVHSDLAWCQGMKHLFSSSATNR